MALIRANSGSGGGSNESEFNVYATGYGGAVFETSKIKSIKTKCVLVETSQYKAKLVGSNTFDTSQTIYQQGGWTDLKTYSSVDSDYVDVTSLVQGYTYFAFTSGTTSTKSDIAVKITWA